MWFLCGCYAGDYAIAIRFLCGCYAVAMRFICGFYVVAVQLLCGCYAVAIGLLCGCYAVAMLFDPLVSIGITMGSNGFRWVQIGCTWLHLAALG